MPAAVAQPERLSGLCHRGGCKRTGAVKRAARTVERRRYGIGTGCGGRLEAAGAGTGTSRGAGAW
jgi:hypothetical protein